MLERRHLVVDCRGLFGGGQQLWKLGTLHAFALNAISNNKWLVHSLCIPIYKWHVKHYEKCRIYIYVRSDT